MFLVDAGSSLATHDSGSDLLLRMINILFANLMIKACHVKVPAVVV